MPRRSSDTDREGPERRRSSASGGGFLPVALGVSGGIALASVAFWLFRKQARRVQDGRAVSVDERVLDVVHQGDHPVLAGSLRVATWLGTHAGVAAVSGFTAIALLRRGRRGDALTVVLSTGGAMLLERYLKVLFARERPQELVRHIRLPASHSFPSGHAMLSAATFPIAAHYLVSNQPFLVRAAGHGAANLVILSIGFSRVYFGVHYPSDVFAGFAAGFGWLGVTSLVHSVASD